MSETHIFTDVDMPHGEYFELSGLRAGVLSMRKPGREGPNEDAAALICVGGSATVAVLSDGAGGHPGGAEAAGLAVRAVCDAVAKLGDDPTNLRGAIINGFESADHAIAALGQRRMEAPAEGAPSKPDDLTLIAISSSGSRA